MIVHNCASQLLGPCVHNFALPNVGGLAAPGGPETLIWPYLGLGEEVSYSSTVFYFGSPSFLGQEDAKKRRSFCLFFEGL